MESKGIKNVLGEDAGAIKKVDFGPMMVAVSAECVIKAHSALQKNSE